MKKIVFVTERMIMGGIEKSLISKLEKIPKDRYEVTVLLMGNNGELLDRIPKNVIVKNTFGIEGTTIKRMKGNIKKGRPITAFKVGWYTWLIQRTKSRFDQNRYYSKIAMAEDTEYDLAIAYHGPVSFPVKHVIENITAKRKIAWIHSDVFHYKSLMARYKTLYEQYDNIFCVSPHTAKQFSKVFPELKDKTAVFYNIMDGKKQMCLSSRGDSYQDKFDGIRILTIGRLEEEKGYDIIPGILKDLLKEGYNIRWYWIGDGLGRKPFEDMIHEYNLEENVILLGTKTNPYPYIKDSDLYVQPSRHEAYCITVAEARVFNKPIITTNTGASEQIKHKQTGVIVDFDEQQLFQAIKELLNDEQLMNKFKDNLSKEKLNTTKEMEKLYKIIGSD